MSKLSALLIGNCQNSGLVTYLKKNKEFADNYEIKIYANWEMIKNKDSLPIKELLNADLFVYQPLPDIYGCYSTDPTVPDSLIHHLKSSCIQISYPYVFNSALWPIYQKNHGQNSWYGDNVINKLLLSKATHDDIIKLYQSNQIDWEYENRFSESISILKTKEIITDVKISNYIESELQNRLLFLIPQHPTSIIFFNIVNQILAKLKMNQLNEDVILDKNETKLPDSTYNNPNGMFPIHSSVINHYRLKNCDSYVLDANQFYLNKLIKYMNMV